MAKIESLDGAAFYKPFKKKKTEKKKPLPASKFHSVIERSQETDYFEKESKNYKDNREITEILEQINKLSEILIEAPTIENIKSYKSVVRYFLEYVVKNLFEVEEKVSGNNILKRKRFTLIKIVDKKLEQLAVDVLNSQKKQFDILKRVDEINGLLVNILR